jgi:hypothetical protein
VEFLSNKLEVLGYLWTHDKMRTWICVGFLSHVNLELDVAERRKVVPLILNAHVVDGPTPSETSVDYLLGG